MGKSLFRVRKHTSDTSGMVSRATRSKPSSEIVETKVYKICKIVPGMRLSNDQFQDQFKCLRLIDHKIFVANQRQVFEWVVELVGWKSHPMGSLANSCKLSLAPILLLGLLHVAPGSPTIHLYAPGLVM